MTKEQKALEYAKQAWGVYFDDVHPDTFIDSTFGEIAQTDYLAGYKEGLKDSELLEALKQALFLLEEATAEDHLLETHCNFIANTFNLINGL